MKIIGTESKLITREELIHEIEIEASLEDSSQKFRDTILNRILLFDKIKVKDIMISIDDIASINIKSKVSEPKHIIKTIKDMEYGDSDAIFVSCTALRIVEVLQEAEDDINKIIISSNQSIIWDSLRSVKINDKIANYGKLFLN